jgi:hypothetical protein
MKLLMLLPNIVLMAISGINLYNEFQLPNANLAVAVLHFAVMVMCLTFVTLIVKSMFRVECTEVEDRQLQHIKEPKVIRLQQTA